MQESPPEYDCIVDGRVKLHWSSLWSPYCLLQTQLYCSLLGTQMFPKTCASWQSVHTIPNAHYTSLLWKCHSRNSLLSKLVHIVVHPNSPGVKIRLNHTCPCDLSSANTTKTSSVWDGSHVAGVFPWPATLTVVGKEGSITHCILVFIFLFVGLKSDKLTSGHHMISRA